MATVYQCVVDVAGRMRQWAQFPVEARPRPVILVGPPVRLPEGGFVDGDAKTAFMHSGVAAAVPVPDRVVEMLRERPESDPAVDPLPITAATRVEREFWTDRGIRVLPAYELAVNGMRGPCLVLDPDVPVWWPFTEEQYRVGLGGPAYVDDDGVTIHLPATGGVLTVFDGARFEEHDTYVIGHTMTHERPATGPVTLPMIVGQVTGRLSSPLGDRVLVDPSGVPFAVPSRTDAERWFPWLRPSE